MASAPNRQSWGDPGQFDVSQEPPSFDVLGMLWRRKLLVILGVLTGLGLGYLYYTTADVVYEIRGQVLVTSKSPTGVNQAAEGIYDEVTKFVGHHKTMTSPVFLEGVVEENGFGRLETFKGKSDAQIVRQMLGGKSSLVVAPDKEVNEIFNIRYRGPIKDDLKVIMKAVIDSYDQYLVDKYSDVSVDQVEKVRADLNEARSNLDETTKQYREFQKNTDLVYRSGEPFSKHQDTLAEIERRLMRSKLQRDELETEASWFKAASSKEDTREALLEIIQKLDTKESEKLRQAIQDAQENQRSTAEEFAIDEIAIPPTLIDSDNTEEVFRLNLELEHLRLKFGESHREVKQKRREIAQWKQFQNSQNAQIMAQWNAEQEAKLAMKEQLRKLKENALADAEAAGSSEVATLLSFEELDYIKVYQISLSQQLAKVEKEITRWTQRQQETLAKTEQLKGDFEKDRDLRDGIERYQRDYERVVDEYQEMTRASRRGGYSFERHSIGGEAAQVEPDLLKMLSISGFLGALVGCGLGYLIEIADKTFRSPDEISRSLDLPLIGHIPVIPTSKRRKNDKTVSQVDESVVAYHRPKSRISEAFRAIRTAIYFNKQETSQILQVTSATPGDGKSTLSANLAVSIAQSGKKVLLVDGDLRRPSAHFLIGVNSDVGFAQVLSGEVQHAHEAYLKTDVEGLTFLPCGTKPANPSELLTSQCLKETLETFREDFDYIIIDSPPLLAVTDPCPVAARVDGVILAIRLKKNVRVSAERATAMLNAVKATVIGVVVNGVGAGNSYYQGYGASNYGGTYSYAYDLGAYGESGDYYSDEDDDSSEFVPSQSGADSRI